MWSGPKRTNSRRRSASIKASITLNVSFLIWSPFKRVGEMSWIKRSFTIIVHMNFFHETKCEIIEKVASFPI